MGGGGGAAHRLSGNGGWGRSGVVATPGLSGYGGMGVGGCTEIG